ncbi:MAG: hypothetical protein OHK93_007952 [Ramalina farinacea]|uniref:Triosephosphate isomerase n=1 Tax=Ramalina farinacea TaxID=258253 RepID=A0AA43QLH3_9LECA|nr:hypothetical protein [Ramalina farinacea]
MPTAPSTLPRRLVGFSTKCYFDLPTTTSYVADLLALLPPRYPSPDLGLFLIPSFPAIPAVAAALDAADPHHTSNPTPRILLGAQNCHHEDSGAFTGEVSPVILKQVGCDIVEIGHAERRRPPLKETDEQIAAKAAAVVRNGMVPLVCIGEKEQPPGLRKRRRDGEGESTSEEDMREEAIRAAAEECEEQVRPIFESVPENAAIIFAYEPVWAIGAAEPADARHVCGVVRELRSYGNSVRRAISANGDVRWLYGGSAGPGVWEGLKQDLDGLFLGRFAHDVKRFIGTVEEVNEG